jgi:hypothetical protein
MGYKDSKDSDVFGKLALGLTVAGLSGYLILSSGVLSSSFFTKGKSLQQNQDPQLEITEWRKELAQISKEGLEKQKELEDLTSRLAKIRLEVQKKDLELRKNQTSKSSTRQIAREKSHPQFKTISDLKNHLEDLSEENFKFNSRMGADGLLYQNVSMDQPFAQNSIFLRRPGIKWARAVSKAAIDLQASDIIIRYGEGEDTLKKARVLHRFIEEQLNGTQADGKLVLAKIGPEDSDSSQLGSASQVDLILSLNPKRPLGGE